MRSRRFGVRLLAALGCLALLGAACSSDGGDDGSTTGSNTSSGDCTPAETPVITFAAYSTPREVYGKIISAFQTQWKEDHEDQQVIFQESYGGSTTQSQNVVNGFQADIVALSLAPDVDAIADAGLITHDWTQAPDGGMVSSSIAVFDVRPGNPDGIQDWNDLAAEGARYGISTKESKKDWSSGRESGNIWVKLPTMMTGRCNCYTYNGKEILVIPSDINMDSDIEATSNQNQENSSYMTVRPTKIRYCYLRVSSKYADEGQSKKR